MRSHRRLGPHELGQNFLTDRRTARTVAALAAAGPGPIIEWAAGQGALTLPLAALGRPLEAVEIDPRRVGQLRRRLPPRVRVVHADILQHALPADLACTVVANVPFGITTAVLRRLLTLPSWQLAVLITQWEVARKRAGIGGATQLTAQWWPWYTFALHRRIPAACFTPRPAVDAGLLVLRRRARPLLDQSERRAYQRWVAEVYAGPGASLSQILTTAGGVPRQAARRWCRREGVTGARPRDLTAEQWVAAFRLRP